MTKRNNTDAKNPDGLDQMTDFQLIQAARADIAFWKLAIEEGMEVIGAESIADFEAKLNTVEKTSKPNASPTKPPPNPSKEWNAQPTPTWSPSPKPTKAAGNSAA